MARPFLAHPLLNDPERLRSAYETKSTVMLAAELGCSVGAVRNACIRFGIGRRDRRTALRATYERTDPSERFWAKVDKDGPVPEHRPDLGPCWLWTGSLHRGCGKLYIDGRNVRAPRYSWELHFGIPPGDLLVCHHCDNPTCVNPSHLFLGTDLDNMRDKATKGRHRSGTGPRPLVQGERNPHARFTDAEVAEMRSLYATGAWSQRRLADRFGTKQPVIQRIVTGKARISS